MCTRTVGVLAHVLEAEGLSTVGIGVVKDWAEKMKCPRMLFCDFPLGRPLGKPGDAGFQRRVLEDAFATI